MAAATSPDRPRVVVVGAGLAGLAAALDLAGGGCEVTLVERHTRAGGRATSFDHRGSGLHLDNGQHVLLGCCSACLDLFGDLGGQDWVRFQPLLRVPVWRDGRRAVLGSWPLPGPLHLLPAVMGYRHLTAAERVRALAAAGGLRSPHRPAGPAAAPVPEGVTAAPLPPGETLESWLGRRGQSPAAIERLWDLVAVAVLNCRAAEAGAREALPILRTGFLSGWRAARLGFFRVALGEVGRRAAAVLGARGASVHLGVAAAGLLIEGGAVKAVRLADGRCLPAEACIAAVPPAALNRLLPAAWSEHPTFRRAAALPWSPILNLYLLYDRPVLRDDLAAFVGGRLQFAFNRGRLLGRSELDGRLIGISLSAADDLTGWSQAEIERNLDDEIRRALPDAQGARLVAAVPVWQRRATFRARPGTAGGRAGPRAPIRGLYLAGDWTDTGWPASLEGAVRSGRTAAALVRCDGGAGRGRPR